MNSMLLAWRASLNHTLGYPPTESSSDALTLVSEDRVVDQLSASKIDVHGELT